MNSNAFRIGAIVALASGCAALSHELIWTRRLVDLLGASSESTARVLGCFFLGLSLGAAWSTRVLRRIVRPWRAVGWLEVGIAIATLPAVYLPSWTGWIWPALGSDALVGWPGGLVKLSLSIAIVVPPAVLMGMTLPVLARAVLRDDRTLGREGVWLYSLNTFGGVLGLMFVSVVTLPAVGSLGAMLCALLLNLVVGGICFYRDHIDRNHNGHIVAVSPPDPTATLKADSAKVDSERSSERSLVPAVCVSFISGMGVLAMEVLIFHSLSNVVYSSFPAVASLLITVIFLLALAAAIAPWITDRFGSAEGILPVALGLTAVVTLVSPLWFVYYTDHLTHLPLAETSFGYFLRVMFTVLITLGPALLLAGIVLPLTFAMFAGQSGQSATRLWGWLLAANGLGGIIGAETANRLLMPWLGMHMSVGVIACLYGLTGVGASVMLRQGRPWARQMAFSIVTATVVFGGLGFALKSLPQVRREGGDEFDEIMTSRDGVVAVARRPNMGLGIVVNNQYLLGSTYGIHHERRQMLLPLILHRSPNAVAHIGTATGITPGAALDYPDVESLITVELSESVATLAQKHFKQFNRAIGDDPRATIVIEDGRTYLASVDSRFDVIVGDLYRPFGAGEGRLFSVEHFRAARTALRQGGLFCQWLPMHQLTRQQFDVVLKSFLSVFPEAHLVRGNLKANYSMLGLVGLRNGSIDWDEIDDRARRLRIFAEIVDPSLRHVAGIKMLHLGVIKPGFAESRQINTLNNAWLEVAAGNLRVTHSYDESYLGGDNWIRFEDDLFARLKRTGQTPSQWAELGRKMCRLNYELTSSSAPRGPDALRAKNVEYQELLESLPDVMREDTGGNWNAFPAR